MKTFGDFRADNISFGVLYGVPIRLSAERNDNGPARRAAGMAPLAPLREEQVTS